MRRLLIVDDEHAVRTKLRKLLDWKALGFERVVAARDGWVAQHIARTLIPDLAIIDVRMPRVDGIAFAEWLRREQFPTQIIFLSGYDEKASLKAAIRLGAIEFLEKPVSREALSAAVEAARPRMGRGRTEGQEGPPQANQPQEDPDAALDVSLESAMDGGPYAERIDSADAVALMERVPSFRTCTSFCCLTVAMNPRTEDGEDGKGRPTAFSKLARLHAARDGRPLYPLLIDDCVLVIIGTGVGTESIQGLSETLFRDAEQLTGDRSAIAISAGLPVGELAEIPKSYRSSRETAEQVFINGFGNLYLSRPGTARPRAEEFSRLSQAFDRAVSSFSEEPAAAALERIARFYRTQGGITKDGILKSLLELAEKSHRAIQDVAWSDGLTDKYHDAIWRMLAKSATLDEAMGEFVLWIRSAISGTQGERRFTKPVFETIRYLQSNLKDRFSLRDLASRAGVSPSYLSRAFHEQTGTSFSEYIIEHRLERAKLLLDLQTLKVYEVATAVGYPDYRHFERLFRKRSGMSPTAYAKRLGRDGTAGPA